jgi:hypothetical protein
LVEPQQAQAVGPGTMTRSRGRCAGNGLRGEEARLALAALTVKLASHLLKRESQMRDQGFCARRLGARPRQLGIAGENKTLERLDLVGKRIWRRHVVLLRGLAEVSEPMKSWLENKARRSFWSVHADASRPICHCPMNV